MFLRIWLLCILIIVVNSLEAGDHCISTYTELKTRPYFNTQCLKLKHCSFLISEYKNKGIRPNVCKAARTGAETLVCCDFHQFDKSRDLLRKNQRVQKIRFEDDYFNLEKCQARDREYKKYSLQEFNPDVLPANASPVDPEYYQHTAAIGWSSSNGIDWNCGGVLITTQFVLTAAHCAWLNGRRPDIVRLGDINLLESHDNDGVQQYKIANIFKHPNYSSATIYNDIALIKLPRHVRKNEKIVPACLMPLNGRIPRGAKLRAAGYGQVEYLGKKAHRLLEVYLDLVTDQFCNSKYDGQPKLPEGIVNTQICTISSLKYPGREMDTCLGDSGGPLQYHRDELFENVRYSDSVVVGLTSFGIGCALHGQPSVYTRIGSYIPWIERVVVREGD